MGGRELELEVKANDSTGIHQDAPPQSVHGLVAMLTEGKLV